MFNMPIVIAIIICQRALNYKNCKNKYENKIQILTYFLT